MQRRSINADIFDIAETRSICSIMVGQNLSEFGEMLGPPSYWGFVDQKSLSCYMGFGALELFLEAEDDAVVIKHMSLDFRASSARYIPIAKNNRWGHSITVTRPPYRDMTLERIRAGADARGLVYTESFEELVHPDTSAALNFDGSVRFYFLKEKVDILSKIQLS